jgi:protein involved in polysaccharide export with SLBB domain
MLPGEQKWTVAEAIAQAGGPTPGANLKKIKFTRGGQFQKLNYYRLQKITDPAKIIYVEAGDIIEVPQTIF